MMIKFREARDERLTQGGEGAPVRPYLTEWQPEQWQWVSGLRRVQVVERLTPDHVHETGYANNFRDVYWIGTIDLTEPDVGWSMVWLYADDGKVDLLATSRGAEVYLLNDKGDTIDRIA